MQDDSHCSKNLKIQTDDMEGENEEVILSWLLKSIQISCM